MPESRPRAWKERTWGGLGCTFPHNREARVHLCKEATPGEVVAESRPWGEPLVPLVSATVLSRKENFRHSFLSGLAEAEQESL